MSGSHFLRPRLRYSTDFDIPHEPGCVFGGSARRETLDVELIVRASTALAVA
jgi:hypothetical protein